MLTLKAKQISSLPPAGMSLVWQVSAGSVIAKLRPNVATRLLQTAPCLVGVPGRGKSPNVGGQHTASSVGLVCASCTRTRYSLTARRPVTVVKVHSPHLQAQFLHTSTWNVSRAKISTTTEEGQKEKPNFAPHFRTAKKKTVSGDEPIHPHAHTANSGEDKTENNGQYLLPHPIWSENEISSVEVTHKKPEGFVDRLAYACVQTLRFSFDTISGYNRGVRTEAKWLIRIIFLETVAGVPGMMGAMARHLRSLRRMQRDHGWIHTLLEEAENERMHLMTALELRKPGKLFTFSVLLAQGIFVNFFFVAYMCSPHFCHRFVGYLEEEAVITYTKLIKDLDDGHLTVWSNMKAPDLAIRYWKLMPDAMIRDVILAIRADEAHHREVNHSLSDLKPDQDNPYPPGK